MTPPTDLTLTLRRHFKAPVERIFDMWTLPPSEGDAFWGPKGFSFVDQTLDLRPGGHWSMTMRAPDGSLHRNGGVYRDIRKPVYLEMTHAWLDENGHFTSPETVVRITLSPSRGGTDMLFEQTGFDSVGSRDGHGQGWGEAFDALENLFHD